MTVVFLVRHGRSTANTSGVLAGWTPGVHLDDKGIEQAHRVGRTLADLRLAQVVASPLERTVETAEAIVDAQRSLRDIALDPRLGECRYGDWSGKKLTQLRKRALWGVIQSRPSEVRFPGEDGESLVEMQARAVTAVRDWNSALGRSAVYAIVSHGDVIKSIIADALGMHLDMFQRIVIDPGSISVVHYGPSGPMVERINDTTEASIKHAKRNRPSTVGGGAGSADGVRHGD